MAKIEKPLSQRIAEREAKKQEPAGRALAGAYRGVFLALRSEIRQAIAEGWSLRKVWMVLREEKKISMGLTSFSRYAAELLPPSQQADSNLSGDEAKSAVSEAPSAKTPPTPAPPVSPEPSPAPPVFRPAEPGFRLNTTPNKEDLL